VAPVTAYLANIKGTYGAQLHLITAGAFIAIIVPLIVFFALQRFFVRGLLAGSVKG
ncbi:MAG: carbohydrate ABC transporter permease, partial [Actinomycetota bacterium]